MGAEQRSEGEGPEGREHQHDGDRQAHVADAVDQEGLLRGRGGARLVLPEADQEVRGEADALPADVQQQVVVGEDEQQHRRQEQVQIAEEAAAPLVVLHVPDRVQVDQRADAGDQQDERHRQLVQLEGDARLEALDRDPAEQVLADGPVLGILAQHVGEEDRADHEGGGREGGTDPVADGVQPPPAAQQYGRSEQRRRYEQRNQVLSVSHGSATPYSFIRLASSTEAEWRERNSDTMIASPTTTSAAATTIVKKAMIWPSRLPCIREKATNARLQALSMSSTHMNTTIAFRLISTPVAPIVNNRAAR